MNILIICLICLILIILLKQRNNFENYLLFENFKDKYNIENDNYDKQYVDICNIIENDKKCIKNDIKNINKYLKNDIPKKIVDLGCGTGHYTNGFLETGYEVIGVDKSRNMLEKATIENPRCDFIRGDIKNNNLFENNTLYNIFIGKNVLNLNTYSDIVEIIKNVSKWIIKGGNIIVNMYDENNMNKIFPREYSQYFKNKNKKNDGINDVTFTHFKKFRYDTWIKNISKNKYDLFEKIVLENGDNRIKKQELTILPKTKLIDLFIQNNFIIKNVIKNRYKYIKNNLLIFQKK